jgi:hypothetical protein
MWAGPRPTGIVKFRANSAVAKYLDYIFNSRRAAGLAF